MTANARELGIHCCITSKHLRPHKTFQAVPTSNWNRHIKLSAILTHSGKTSDSNEALHSIVNPVFEAASQGTPHGTTSSVGGCTTDG